MSIFFAVFFANVNVCTITTALITLNRAIALWNFRVAEKMFTWKKTLIYFVVLWIYSIGFLSLPLLEIWGDFKYYDGTFSCTFDNEVPLKKLFLGISFVIIVLVLISSSVAMNRFMRWSTERVSFYCGNVSKELSDAIIKRYKSIINLF